MAFIVEARKDILNLFFLRGIGEDRVGGGRKGGVWRQHTQRSGGERCSAAGRGRGRKLRGGREGERSGRHCCWDGSGGGGVNGGREGGEFDVTVLLFWRRKTDRFDQPVLVKATANCKRGKKKKIVIKFYSQILSIIYL